MRNVQILTEKFGVVPHIRTRWTHIKCSIDSPSEHLFVATQDGDSLQLVVFDLKTCVTLFKVPLSDPSDSEPLIESGDTLVDIQYLAEFESVCIVTSLGSILLVGVKDDRSIEMVGMISGGIQAACWSPDQELFAIAAKNGSVMLMTSDWDVLSEVAIEENSELSAPASISWRGDGQLFSLNALLTGERRVYVYDRAGVRQSASESGVGGMGALVAWKSDGELIATVQKRFKTPAGKSKEDSPKEVFSHQVIFFERNGLRHGEFDVRDLHCDLRSMQWNCDGDMLALATLTPSGEGRVEVWTRGNYHWYLKQRLCYSTPVSSVCWDPERANHLATVTADGRVHWLHLIRRFDVTQSGAHCAGVVDGRTLLLTPLSKMAMPPPMSASRVDLPAPAREVFHCRANPNRLGALTCDNSLVLCGPINTENPFEAPKIEAVIDVESFSDYHFGSLRSFVWLTERTLLAVETCADTHRDKLVELEVNNEKLISVNCLEVGESDQSIIGLFPYLKLGCVLLQTSTGKVVRYLPHSMHPDISDSAHRLDEFDSFPVPCATWEVVDMGQKPYQTPTLLGLDHRGRLYLGGRQLHHQATSFAVHPEFCLFVTGGPQHIMFCLKRSKSPEELWREEENADPDAYRFVERGSLLVTAVGGGIDRVVLQMPRGNLEVIHARALVLDTVRCALEGRKYGEAFATVRRHRIDYNLIVDHNMERFLEDVDLFVEQVTSVDKLNIFLTNLTNDDVTKTKYLGYEAGSPPGEDLSEEQKEEEEGEMLTSLTLSDRKEKPVPTSISDPTSPIAKPSKVDAVMAALRAAFMRANTSGESRDLTLPVLTTYLRTQVPGPRLQEALLHVRQLRDNTSSGSVSAEAALKYIIFLANINDLYLEALGMYDFDMVMMVVQQGKDFDPKEYLPFLTELQKMGTNECRHAIDMHLKRYSRALAHLARCEGRFEDCLTLIEEHKLFSEAREIWRRPSDPVDSTAAEQWKRVMCAYAKSLEAGKPAEAGLAYETCGMLDEAIRCYSQTLSHWRSAFVLAGRAHWDRARRAELAIQVADMARAHEPSVAARVLAEEAGDVDGAVELLVKSGGAWTAAMRLSYSHQREDLVETIVKPAVVDEYSVKMKEIAENKERYAYCTRRLRIVRYKKQQDGELCDDDELDALDGAETASTASTFSWQSLSTATSVLSARSAYAPRQSNALSHGAPADGLSKNERTRKKRDERKKRKKGGRRREGTAREEQHLVEELKQITQSEVSKQRISEFLHVLIGFGMHSEAQQMQSCYEEFINLIELQESMPMSEVKRKQKDGSYKKTQPWPEEVHPSDVVPDNRDWRISFLSSAKR
eukprot:151225_1